MLWFLMIHASCLLQTFLTFQRISRTYDLCKWQILVATPSPGMYNGERSTRLYNLLLNGTGRRMSFHRPTRICKGLNEVHGFIILETVSSLARRETFQLLWNLKVHKHVHKMVLLGE